MNDQVIKVSVSSRCIIVGILAFLYWAAAFASAVAYHSHRDIPGWLTPAWLVEPARFIGDPCLDLLRDTIGHNNLYAPGSPGAWALLLLAAAGMGTGAWLLASLAARSRAARPGPYDKQ